MDAGELLVDAGNGNAQTMPARVLTADTDATRLESGILQFFGMPTVVVTGPIVMTRWTTAGSTNTLATIWVMPEAMACDPAGKATAIVGYNDGLTGFFVRAGQKLCATAQYGSIVWAGYRPY